MISLLVQPTMTLIKQHMVLSGMNIDKAKYIESEGLDIDSVIDKVIKGKDTVAIIYERQRIKKDSLASKPIEFAITDDQGVIRKRKAIIATVPFNISIVTNQLLDLDNYELLHRLELATTSFPFTLNIPDEPEQRMEYLLSYSEAQKANDHTSNRTLVKGFHVYNFTVSVQGYLLAPYTNRADIVTRVDFYLTFDEHPEDIPESTDNNSVLIVVPKP